MDISLIFKIAGVGVIIAILNSLLTKAGREDHALLMNIAGLVIVLILVSEKISELINLLKSLFVF